jgi:hypothetical protein
MTIFKAERLANQFEHRRPGRRESVRAVGRHGFDRRHLITEPGDQRHCALSLSKGMPSHCALSLSKGTDIDRLLLLPAWTVWRRPRRRQGQALRAAPLRQCREQEGECVEGFG